MARGRASICSADWSIVPGSTLVLRPAANLRAHLEAVDDDGTQRLYPGPLEHSPLLLTGRSYALPGPNSFFESSGRARLRLVVAPEAFGDGPVAHATPALATTRQRFLSIPLTDGAPSRVVERRFEGAGPVAVELDLASR